MNLPQIKEFGKLLASIGIIEQERDVMNLLMPMVKSYELDIAKFNDLMDSKYPECASRGISIKDFFIEKFGEQFWNQFEKFI